MSSERAEMLFEQLKFEIAKCRDPENRAKIIRKAMDSGIQLSKINSLLDWVELQEQAARPVVNKIPADTTESIRSPNMGPIPGSS